jgi:hypothetical protein
LIRAIGADEAATLAAARTLAHADRAAEVVPAIGPSVDAILAGADASAAFTGIAFDLLCRALFSSRGHGDDVRAAVATLCARSEARFGAQPWSDLYRACLLHLAGDAEAAARLYHAAARDTALLWPNSIGCRSVIAPMERDAWSAAPPVEPSPMRIVQVGVGDGPILMIACDTRYLRAYAPAYLRSITAHCPSALVHVHLIDPAPDDIAWLEATASPLRPAISCETHSGPEPRAWFALARFVRLVELLALYDRPILVTDIDAAFTRAPIIPAADIGLRIKRRGFRAHPWQTVQAGALSVSPTVPGHAAVTLLRRLALGSYATRGGQGIWFVDQNVLFTAYRMLATNGATTIADIAEEGLPGGLRFGRAL